MVPVLANFWFNTCHLNVTTRSYWLLILNTLELGVFNDDGKCCSALLSSQGTKVYYIIFSLMVLLLIKTYEHPIRVFFIIERWLSYKETPNNYWRNTKIMPWTPDATLIVQHICQAFKLYHISYSVSPTFLLMDKRFSKGTNPVHWKLAKIR